MVRTKPFPGRHTEMFVPFPILNASLRDKAPLEGLQFLVGVGNAFCSFDEFANEERSMTDFFSRVTSKFISSTRVMDANIEITYPVLVVLHCPFRRLISKDTLDPVSYTPPKLILVLASAARWGQTRKNFSKFRFCFELLFVQLKAGNLQFFD